jgi:hypothetical protein
MEEMMRLYLSEQWEQAKPVVKKLLLHKARGSEIAEKAVMTGAVVAVGIGVMLAFMNGLGTFFTNVTSKITAMVP